MNSIDAATIFYDSLFKRMPLFCITKLLALTQLFALLHEAVVKQGHAF